MLCNLQVLQLSGMNVFTLNIPSLHAPAEVVCSLLDLSTCIRFGFFFFYFEILKIKMQGFALLKVKKCSSE